MEGSFCYAPLGSIVSHLGGLYPFKDGPADDSFDLRGKESHTEKRSGEFEQLFHTVDVHLCQGLADAGRVVKRYIGVVKQP